MELLRIPGLLVYTARLCLAKSEPERLHIKRVRSPGHLQAHTAPGHGRDALGKLRLSWSCGRFVWRATTQGVLLALAVWG